MPVRLDIRLCWRWQCPHCPRSMHYPTTLTMQGQGVQEAERHLLDMHGIAGRDATSNWTKDHWPRITACK